MIKIWLSLFLFSMLLTSVLVTNVDAQTTQTLRGRIVDEVNSTALVGVNIIVVTASGETSALGSTTDTEGDYRISNVPLGRQTIKITYIGYEEQVIPNIVVTAGKEVILNISLRESVSELEAVEIVSDTKEDKTATNNDQAMVSSRSFNVDDTKRYAGALGDPSRMAANFAGVVGGDDSRNDIVVRGNSPTGMLWQLEGLNIPNPNHFGALVSTGGPVSMLNNNNLDKSDFMTSAFPAQYGNATAGVFDLKLRDGNNEQREFMGQVGFNGFEFGAEGPFSKKSDASFVVNYRYSTLAVFQKMGIEFLTGGNTPFYQDLNFKVSVPSGTKGKFTFFGIGGVSKIDLLGSEADLDEDADLYGDENMDSYPKYRTGIAGVSYEYKVTPATIAKITAGISATSESFTADSLVRNAEEEVVGRFLRMESDFNTRKYSVNFATRTKINAKNSITAGATLDVTDFDLYNHDIYANLDRDTVRQNAQDKTSLVQGYATWKHRFNERFSFATGVHGQYYSLSESGAIEPRVNFQYMINLKHSVSIGYGIHNQIQNITTSYAQTKTLTGQMIETNKDLGFTSSQHFVLTYDWNLTGNTRLKAETYYQKLDNVPVETSRSTYSALNTGSSFGPSDADSLVNKGKGTNYGLELTLERFFDKGFYYLMTTSLFDSKYEGSDGRERNTAYNTQYVFNILAGKEWKLRGEGKFLAVSLKLTSIGGKYLTPIDFERSQQFGRTIYKESKAYTEKQDPYFRSDVRISYRKEYKKSTLEISLDMQNVSNNKNIFSQNYNARTNKIVTQYQQAFFPVPYVRFTF